MASILSNHILFGNFKLSKLDALLIVAIFISRNERVFISLAKSSTTDNRNWRVTSLTKVMIHLLRCSSDMQLSIDGLCKGIDD
ncbi:hypothetical protein OUZ56_021897 [Daphnia magna]|uniref:Uncharacterized protein n=1 Tax=Daphnia magna TaxID=35525 RepID=A0ABR0AUT4_9CRUS|nr:hypothetical protein OUZ56_021897 [Daphnia magna]